MALNRSKRLPTAVVLSFARDHRKQFSWCRVVDDIAVIVESAAGDGLVYQQSVLAEINRNNEAFARWYCILVGCCDGEGVDLLEKGLGCTLPE